MFDPRTSASTPLLHNMNINDADDSSISSDSTASSTHLKTPFLNQHAPEFQALRQSLRDYFQHKNRLKQLRSKPWIFLIQIVKIITVTILLTTFTKDNFAVRNAMTELKTSLSHLLIKDYEAGDSAQRIIYSYHDLECLTVYAAEQYFNLSHNAISLLGYPEGLRIETPPPILFDIAHYASANISDIGWNIELNETVEHHYANLSCNVSDGMCVERNREVFSAKNFVTQLISYTMTFNLQALVIGIINEPKCVRLDEEISFVNTQHASGLELHTVMGYEFIPCGDQTNNESNMVMLRAIFVDGLVGLISLISICLIARKLKKAHLLYIRTVIFFRVTYNRELNNKERMLFVNCWFMSSIVADVCLIIACTMKVLIDLGLVFYFDWCSLILGCGVWLTYIGLLRFLIFNHHYSMLMNTMVVALPHLARFLVCVTIIFGAYLLSGWLVLSPFSTKFADINTTAETLFSLLNGDDMFATFVTIIVNGNCWGIYVFSRLYLYSYVCFFIYIVLSLFISIIGDAYVVVSNFRSDACPWVQSACVFPEFVTPWEEHVIHQRTGDDRRVSQCFKAGDYAS